MSIKGHNALKVCRADNGTNGLTHFEIRITCRINIRRMEELSGCYSFTKDWSLCRLYCSFPFHFGSVVKHADLTVPAGGGCGSCPLAHKRGTPDKGT